jgi:short-subunit dehydrogenase
LVTGGSSGIGWAIAKELAKRGFQLLLVSNQEEELAQCKAKIEQQFSVACYTLFRDLTTPTAAQEIFDFCTEKKWEILVLINNAGMLVFSETISTPIAKINAILKLHVYTPTMLCRLFGEQFEHQKKGWILNVSSISAVMPYPGISMYGPTKTYMRYFTRAFRSEMKRYKVYVTCLLPGATETGLYDPNRINLSLAKKIGVIVSCDINYRKNLWSRDKACEVMTGLMPYVDICISNEEDAADVFGIKAQGSDVEKGQLSRDGYIKVAAQLVDRFDFKKVAITLRGSISASDNLWSGMIYDGKNSYFAPEYTVHSVDRVGGGDSFGAGLIYSQLNKFDDQKSVEFATAASCLKHSIEGDFNLVSLQEVEALMAGDASGRVRR